MGKVTSQFFDLKEILFKGRIEGVGNRFVFLGDYVDRGPHGIETLILLFLLKLKYPTEFFLIRGNHESRYLTQNYGFMMECQFKFKSLKVWNYFTKTFAHMPIAAVLNEKYFLVHGGLSPEFELIGELDKVNR